MPIELKTPEAILEESKRISLMIAQRHLSRTLAELAWLVNAVPDGSDLRAKLYDASINATKCATALQGMKL